jgi:hypothetical protein
MQAQRNAACKVASASNINYGHNVHPAIFSLETHVKILAPAHSNVKLIGHRTCVYGLCHGMLQEGDSWAGQVAVVFLN